MISVANKHYKYDCWKEFDSDINHVCFLFNLIDEWKPERNWSVDTAVMVSDANPDVRKHLSSF